MADKTHFAKTEEELRKRWEDEATFNASVEKNKDNKEYVFFDGPPFANGLPHYGHLLTGFIKDIYARYHTMKGEKVERRFGWDCHGLPAEHSQKMRLKSLMRTAKRRNSPVASKILST